MGNAQNAHLDRHGSRASSTSDVSSLGSNRHSRALDNVSLLSVDAVLTSYERRAFGELEAQAEADYSPPNAGPRSRSQTHPNPQVPPDPHLLSPGHQDRGHVSTSSYSDYSDQLSEGSPRSPVNDEEAAKWHEWTSKSDDDGLSDDRDSIDDSDELDVSRVNQDNKETAGASSEKDIAGPKDMEDTETPVLHSDTKDSLPQSSSSTEDVHVNIHSSSDDLSAHQDPGAVEPLDNKAGDTLVNSDTNTDTNIRLSNSGSVDDLDKFSDTVEVQSDSDALKTDSNQAMEEAIEPKEGNTGGDEVRHPDLHTDDSEDEVFSGSATDTPVGTPLARSRPVSIDDLLDCLQETAVDELELSARKKSAELGDAESASKSPTPPPILTPPPVGHMAMFSHLEDSDMIVNAEDYPHLHEIARSEPRSEPVTDLDDDSDDEEFQQSLFKDMESNDPEKSATRDEMSRLLMEMQRFGMKVEDDADSEDGSLEKERKVSRESVSSGGEYDTATMKVKRDVYSDSSDSSDDESSDSEDEKKVRESKYDSSSEEDEIIQHITPELIEKVINADDTMVDLFADGNDEPTTPTQTQEESVTPTDVLKDEPDPAKSDHGLESSEQEQYVHGSAPEIPVATLLENITGPVEETEPSDSKTSAVVAEAGDIKLSGVGEKEELEGNEKDHLEPSEKDEVSANGEEVLKVSKEEEEDNEKGSLEMSENDKEKEDIELSEKAMIASNKNESIDNFEKEQGDGTDKNDIESSEKDEVEPIEKSSQDYDMKEPVTATSAENSLSVETSNDIKERSDKDADSEDVSIKDGSQPEAEKDKDDKKESDAQVSDTKTEIIHEAIAVEIIQPELSHNLEGSVQSEKSLDDPDRKEIDELVDQVDNVPQEAISPLKQPIDSVSPQDTITKGEDTVVATPLIVIDEAEVEETSADNTANVISEVSQVDEMVSDLAKDSDKSSENKTLVDVVEGNIPDSDGASKADVDVIQDTVSADKADKIVESIPLSQVDGDSNDIVVQSLDKVDQDLDNDNDKDQAVDTEIPTVDDHQAVDTEIPTVDDQHPTEPTDPEPRTDDDSDIETIRVLNTQVSDCANSDSLSEFKEAATDDEIVKASEASAPLESSPNTAEVPVEAANDEETEAKQLEPSKEEEGSEEVVVADAPEEPPAPDKPAEIIDGKAVEEKEQEAEVVQETQIITAEVTFKQEQFVFETITEVKDENDEDVTPDIKDKVTSEGCPLPSEAVVEAKPTKLDVIIEEEQPEIRSPETDKAQNEDDDDDDGSEPPPLPTSPPPNAIPQENKEKPMVSPEKLPPPVPEHQGYSRQLLRVISKKYPFRPMPKEPEAQHYYRQMMRQIETEIHKMIHAPEDPVRSDQTRASYRERKTSVPPPARLTMQTPVPPPPRAQTASRPPQHPAMIPTKSEPRKELSRKELKRRESETRKSKKLKKKDKENESRMAQFAQFMKLGSLSKEHGKTDTKKEEKEEKQPPPPPQQDTSPVPPPTGGHMVQRSVIIHRDERGYGLTVSGDNPVFVQCVKENGAAARVGVQEGDRIFKVNGTLVTQSNHVEVVKLIKSGPYVALTLLGRASGGRPGGSDADQPGGPGSPPVPGDAGSNRITGPQPVNDAMNLDLQNQKVALTRMMYEKATSQLENMKAERNLSEAELNDQLRTIRRLESALFDLTGIPAESHLPGGPRQRKSDSGPDVMYGDDIPRRDVTVTRTLSDSRKRISHHEGIDHTQDRNKTTSLPSSVTDPSDPPPHSPSPGKDDGPLSDSADDYGDSAHYDEGGPAIIPMMQQMSSEGGPYSPNQVSNIMGAEDDFSTDEDGAMEEHGPFSDLNALKRKPSHLAVFLNYLISNSDPSPLLFYLVTEDYAKGTTKEMKKWLYEIHSTFLVNKAPLRVNVDESIVSNIDNTLLTKSDKVDAIQSAFGLARHHAQNEISELLADFRNKCALGLGSLYGTHEISIKDTMERSKELHLVEKYLVPHFERLMDRPEDAPDRNQAMAYALATVLKQVGCTLSGKAGTMLDRCPSFVAKDTKMFKLKTKKRQITVRDHTFVNVAYYSTTHCHQCSGIIWGIGLQGYQCAVCEMNVHKQCAEHVKESCSAGHKDRKKTKRTSSIMNIIRKPSSVTQPQITSKDPRWSDDGYTSPGSSSTFLRLHKDDDNDDESDRLNVTRPVSQMIEQLSPRSTDEPRSPSSPPRPRSPETGPDADAEQRKHVVRSESLKGKQEAKSKTVRRSQSDLHVDDPHVKNVLNQSGSDTSIAGSLESPSNSSELLHDRGDSSWTKPLIEERYDDSDLEVENELPTLNTSIGADVVKKLKPKEKKRQDVMNELFHTERTHVRTLKVMNTVFYANMSEAFSMDLVQLLLPNIEELVQLHCSLNNSFKVRRKENTTVTHVGDLLLSRFSGEEGEKYKAACAHFCRSQSYALETLRVRQRKDQKLAMFLQESSMNPLCRRLELKDLIPTVMQRLTKYPLLIESLLKYTQVNTEEHDQLKEALVCTKDILSYVNEAVKEFEFQQKLAEIQKRLDKRSFENSSLPMVAEYKNLDLTQHKMVYNGPLTWRIGRNKQIELHVVLLEDIMVLLQRQDDKYVLKCSTTVVFGREDSKYTHSPILKLSNVLARNVAVDKRAFFLVCTSDIGPQIYELHAMSSEEKNKWLRYITEAVDSYKERTQKQPNKTPTATSPDQKAPRSRKESKEEPVEAEGLETYRSNSVDSLDKVTVLHPTSQTELIQPTEVVISDTVLEEAEPVLSAREKLKQTDESVRQRLEEKDRLIAEILNVPPSHYANIAEMASEIEGEKDIRDLVLGASYQTTRLTQLVNDSLTVPTEEESTTEEPVSPTSGTASAGKADDKPAVMVTIASNPILDITKKLNEQLSMLLNLFGEQEEQNKRLQRDLDVANEQLTLARDVPHHRSPSNSLSRHSRPNSFASITSSTSEVAETPEDMLTPTVASTEESGIYPVNSTPQDVSMTTVFEVMKLDVVEADADDANQNLQTVQSSESVSVAPTTISASIVTDANLNNPPPDEDSATTT